jgi:hypothetical protein
VRNASRSSPAAEPIERTPSAAREAHLGDARVGEQAQRAQPDEGEGDREQSAGGRSGSGNHRWPGRGGSRRFHPVDTLVGRGPHHDRAAVHRHRDLRIASVRTGDQTGTAHAALAGNPTTAKPPTATATTQRRTDRFTRSAIQTSRA